MRRGQLQPIRIQRPASHARNMSFMLADPSNHYLVFFAVSMGLSPCLFETYRSIRVACEEAHIAKSVHCGSYACPAAMNVATVRPPTAHNFHIHALRDGVVLPPAQRLSGSVGAVTNYFVILRIGELQLHFALLA